MFLAKHCPDVETAINEISKHIKENYNDLFLNVILTNKYSNYTSREFKSLATDPFLSESLEKEINELDQIQGVLQFNQNNQLEELKWFSFTGSSNSNHDHSQNYHYDLSDYFEDTESFECENEEKPETEYTEEVVTSEINSKEGITLLLNQNKNPKIGEYITFAFKSKMYESIKVYIKDVFSNFNKRNSSFANHNPPLFPAMFIKRTRNF